MSSLRNSEKTKDFLRSTCTKAAPMPSIWRSRHVMSGWSRSKHFVSSHKRPCRRAPVLEKVAAGTPPSLRAHSAATPNHSPGGNGRKNRRYGRRILVEVAAGDDRRAAKLRSLREELL